MGSEQSTRRAGGGGAPTTDTIAGFSRVQVRELRAYHSILKRLSPSGKVDRKAFSLIFHGPPVVAEKLFDLLDSGHSDVIDCDEYIRGMSVFCTGSTKEKLEFLYSLYDPNHMGHVSEDDYVRVTQDVLRFGHAIAKASGNIVPVKSPTEAAAEARQHFQAMDRDRDHVVSKVEFVQYAQTIPGFELVKILDEQLHALFIPEGLNVHIGVVGPAGSGKTAFLQKTLGVNGVHFSYKYAYDLHLQDGDVHLDILDSDLYNQDLALVGVDVVLVVYSVTETPLSEIEELIQKVREKAPKARIVLMASKIDLRDADRTALQPLHGHQLVKQYDLDAYHEVFINDELDHLTAVLESAVSCVVPPFILRPNHTPAAVALVGPKNSGKSGFLKAVVGPNVGLSYHYHVDRKVHDTCFHVSIIDSDGHNRAVALRGAELVYIVYAITNDDEQELKRICGQISAICPDATTVLVGSKVDLRDPAKLSPEALYRALTPEAGARLAERIGARAYLEVTSADVQRCVSAFDAGLATVVPEFSVVPKDVTPVEAPHVRRVATWDYEPEETSDDNQYLAFTKYDVITVLKEVEGDWWYGSMPKGTEGWFPVAYTRPY